MAVWSNDAGVALLYLVRDKLEIVYSFFVSLLIVWLLNFLSQS
jgi:hypothetical protein